MTVTFLDGTGLDDLAGVFAELHRHYVGDAAPPLAVVRDNLRHALCAGGADVRVAVARQGGSIAGIATVARLIPAPGAQAQLFMKDLYVREAWRGQGVGERLMAFLARHALQQGCVRLDWTTETGNPAALAFYDRLGAARVTEKVYFRFSGDALAALARRAPEPASAAAPEPPPPAPACALHDDTVPPLLQALTALHRVLDAVARLPAAQAQAVLQARLADDMLDFSRQVETACFMTLRAAFPLTGRPVPPFGDEPRTAPGLRARVQRAEALLRALRPSDFAAPPEQVHERAGQAAVVLPPAAFLRRFALPNVLFHVSMAYALARSHGAVLGKGDFDGLHVYPG
jgi:uncharacterized protein